MNSLRKEEVLGLDGFKTITYNDKSMKSGERAEEIASWYLTENISLYFLAKHFGLKRPINVELFFKRNGEWYKHHVSYSFLNDKDSYNLPILTNVELVSIRIRFLSNVSYFHIGIECEGIKFAYKHYKRKVQDDIFELGTFAKYDDKGYRFFPNTNFCEKVERVVVI